MNSRLALHELTKRQLEQFAGQPSHALALIGPAGSGKTVVALWLVTKLTKTPIEKVTQQAYFKLITPGGRSISIDEIRELGHFLKLKTTGRGELRRFVVIEQAEGLTLEAQNALLKILEEPPADTLIILTLNKRGSVLPTISSRLQQIIVRRPAKADLQALFAGDDFEQLYALSGGRPGLLSALIEQGAEQPLLKAVAAAKQLLQATAFERLAIINELARGDDSAALLEALKRIAETSLRQAARQHNDDALKRWQKVLAAAHEASVALGKGAQSKLAFTELVLNA